ncbi:MAG: thioredoxin domain-containing protein [Litorimonas sp.]
MKIAFKSIMAAASLGFLTNVGVSASTQAQSYRTINSVPDVYVVMFRADWCAPCKVVEPRLSEALRSLHDSRIEYVNIDISNNQGSWNANAVFDRGIVEQYNRWMGITGFAAVIDGDTKQTLGCLNINYDANAMVSHIRNLQGQAQRNQQSFDITCPASNQPGYG